MGTPTKGSFDETYLHFFINNSQRYIGLPGIYHTKIDNRIFDAIRDRVTSSDIPTSEIGETDTRLYGVELIDGNLIIEKVEEVLNQTMKSLVNNETYRTTDMIAFTDLNVHDASVKLDTLITKVDALLDKIAAKPA